MERTVRLVKALAGDGMELDGIASIPSGAIASVVHVHGKCGNFYQNRFIGRMVEEYPTRGLAFFSINSRAHDVLAEAYVDGRLAYTGGSVETARYSEDDVAAAVALARSEVQGPVFVQGHSYGCDKAVLFAQAHPEECTGLILLSPADSQSLQQTWLGTELIEAQEARMAGVGRFDGDYVLADDLAELGSSLRLLLTEYGVPGPSGYPIPVTEGALAALLGGSALTQFSDPLSLPHVACLLYIGGADPLQTWTQDEWREVLNGRTQELLYVPQGDHHFRGLESPIIDHISAWVERITLRGLEPQ